MKQQAAVVQVNNMPATLLPSNKEAVIKELKSLLERMDGTTTWIVNFWHMPEGTDPKRKSPVYVENFIQFIGAANALSIQIRILIDGYIRQFTVGKPATEPTAELSKTITFAPANAWSRTISVAPHEIYTAQEAMDVLTTYFETGEVSDDASIREVELEAVPSPSNSRLLKFTDVQGNELIWEPGQEQSAAETFGQFFKAHISRENARFTISDEAASEALTLMVDTRAVRREKFGKTTQAQYTLTHELDDYLVLARAFIKREGYDALDKLGPWLPDEASHKQALLKEIFKSTTIAKTSVQKLRQRLTVLAYVAGSPPLIEDDATHYFYQSPNGDMVHAWFKKDGRGLVTTFWPESPLNVSDDTKQQELLYQGIPDDLRALAKGVPATGVFLFERPCEMSEGTVAALQSKGLEIEATGIERLLAQAMALKNFTPQALKRLDTGWGASAIKNGFKMAAQYEAVLPTVKRSRMDILGFLFYLDAYGVYDKYKVHYVFPGHLTEDARKDILEIASVLGLEQVEPPVDENPQSIWIRADNDLDAELNSWSSIGVRTGTRIVKSYDRAGLAEKWAQWCNPDAPWGRKAKNRYESDSLYREDGSLKTLLTETFMEAYERAGALTTDDTTAYSQVDRSFSIIVKKNDIEVIVEVQLGRNSNSEDFITYVRYKGVALTFPRSLSTAAYSILEDRNELKDDKPLPSRPIIVSHSHLEVTAREIVEMMRKVANDWDRRLIKE